jgi:hypothetical protein
MLIILGEIARISLGGNQDLYRLEKGFTIRGFKNLKRFARSS